MTQHNDIYAQRRARLAKKVAEQGGGIVVLFSGQELIRNRDCEFPFRWDSYFYYLTGFPEPDAALMLVVGDSQHHSVLFCREKNVEREIWDGFRFGPDASVEEFGVDAAYEIGALDKQMGCALMNQAAIYTALGADEQADRRLRVWLSNVRAQSRSGAGVPERAHDVHALIDEMRLIKDSHELDIMSRAADISAGAHRRAMQHCKPGCFEYQIEAELLHEFRRHGSQFPAYGSIVAGGANACVLHYRANDAKLADGDLLLIDAGCELDGYASDITRTFPVNGRFSSAQREIYDIVLASQHAALDATRPGNTFDDPHQAATRVLVQGLIDCGLVNGSLDEAIEAGDFRRFYMHRTSHWMGMDVHDCGDYRERAAAEQDQTPPWRTLRPGMVLTIEPGLYIAAADDIDPKYHNIGIRIEDDAVVTQDGHLNLTAAVPTDAVAIERLMASDQ